MSFAHFGVGIFVMGVSIVQAFSIEEDLRMLPGESVEVADYSFELRELRNVEGPNFSAIEGQIEIRKNGKFVGELRPQKRTYLVQQNPMTEAGILASLHRDLFVALGDPLGNGAWSVRLQYKPMIRLIWLGALIMALGGLIAASDRRYQFAKGAVPATDKASPGRQPA
jgi:cytochrome c-type biogenesis protein CcmF